MIHGIGIDIVNIPKFKKAIDRWGKRLEARLFTHKELAYCEKRKFTEQHLAVRFAAKEAFLKALGKRLMLSKIEVTNNQNGIPSITILDLESHILNPKSPISSPESHTLRSLHHIMSHVTLTHDWDYCIAQVILETDEKSPAEGTIK